MSDFGTLLVNSKSGDRQSLSALLARYENYLQLLARTRIDGRLQSKIDTGDVIQETALSALRDFPQFRGNTEPELAAWLRTVLSNVCATLERRYFGTQSRDIRREISTQLESSGSQLNQLVATQRNTPSESAARRELAVLAADAIASLPDECRDAIVRHHLNDQGISEIADDMGKSRHAIRRLLAKSTILLQKALEDLNEF